MDKSGKRLGIAMLTVVFVLALNAFAVLSGAADGAYGLLFGSQPARYLAATHGQQATAPRPVLSTAECAPSSPKRAFSPGLVTVTGAPVEAVRVARMC